MKSRLLSNGCSFNTPRPKDGVETFVSKEIAKHYNLEHTNLAMGGRGNKRIGFTTKWYFELEKEAGQDSFVVIGWSSMVRNDYVSSDKHKVDRIDRTEIGWRTWKTTDEIKWLQGFKGYDIENTLRMDFLDCVINLQSYLKLNKIPYVMYNALPNYNDDTILDFDVLSEAIDMTRFFAPSTSHMEWIQQRGFVVSENDPHPSEEGHKIWAKQLIEFIDANDLRTYK